MTVTNRSKARKAGILLAVSTLSCVPSLTSFGQSSDEIIVTATKRAQSVLEVPVSLSVFSAADIEAFHADGLADLSNFVPNVWQPPATEAVQSFITIRGLGQGIARSSGRAVGVYIDGVYVSGDTQTDVALADIASVEVLRGPQGTVFGRDTLGGAVTITTQKPGAEAQGRLALELGNFGRRQIIGKASLPLAKDKLWFGASVLKRDTGGYIDNAFTGVKSGSQDRFAIGTQLYYSATPAFEARVVYSYQNIDDRPNSQGEATTNLGSDTIPYTINLGLDESHVQDAHRLSVSLDYVNAAGFKFTSISGWSDLQSDFIQDSDRLPADITTNRFESAASEISQEFRITSPEYDRFDYLLGLYYLRSENFFSPTFPLMNAAFFDAVPFLNPNPIPVDELDGQRIFTNTRTIAAFGRVNIHVNERFSLFGGLRLTDENKVVDYASFGESFLAFGLPPLTFQQTIDYSPLSWSFGGRYALAQGINSYISVSRGFRGASVKDDFVSQGDLDLGGGFFTQPEFATTYEVGLKSSVYAGRLRANLSVFYTDYTDIQVTVPDPVFNFLRRFENAASAQIYGFEADFSAQISDSLRVSGAAGYLKTEFLNFAARPELVGTGFGSAPEWTYSFAADYERGLSLGPFKGVWQVHGDYYGRTSPDDFVFETVAFVGDHGILGASTSFVPDEQNWQIKLWVKNLTDVNDPEVSINLGMGLGPFLDNITVRYEEPRSYGVTLDVRF